VGCSEVESVDLEGCRLAKGCTVEVQWWGGGEGCGGEAGYCGDYMKSCGHVAVNPVDPLIAVGVQDADHRLTHLSTAMPRAGCECSAHAALHW